MIFKALKQRVSLHYDAAVDVDGLSGDVRGCWSTKPGDQAGTLVGTAVALHGDGLDKTLPLLAVRAALTSLRAVAKMPGQTQLTVMPWGPSSPARDMVNS